MMNVVTGWKHLEQTSFMIFILPIFHATELFRIFIQVNRSVNYEEVNRSTKFLYQRMHHTMVFGCLDEIID